MSNDVENFILNTIERWWSGHYQERHGLVTSYDPKKYLAKVTFMPHGQESGWLPIETGHIGQGYGITVGLQPGSGGTQQGGSGEDTNTGGGDKSKLGDQVIVRYQSGDFESGKIVQRVHSDHDTPPETQAGEIVIWTKFKQDDGAGSGDAGEGGQGGEGQQIKFLKDGSLVLTDGNGASITLDGNGNIKIKGKTITVIATKDVGIKGDGNVELKAGDNAGIDAGSEVIVQGGGDASDGSVSPPKGQPSIPPFQVP